MDSRLLSDIDFSDFSRNEKLSTYRQLNQTNLEQGYAAYQSGSPVSQLVTSRAAFIDQLLSHLWWRFQLDQEAVALVAVGGYGRGELHPHSDIDLLLLSDKSVSEQAGEKISAFITLLWDIRLEVGQSVRSVKQCIQQGKQDITIATNLTEARLVSGPAEPFDKLQQQVKSARFWPSAQFFKAKYAEQQQRHLQYHDTAYNLEPNIKANPGGLRDLQTIAWIAKNHFAAAATEQLVSHGFLSDDEYRELLTCEQFLWQIRFVLHMVTGRAEDRLLFEHQPAVAAALGYCDESNLAVEKMMKRFYRTVRLVIELNHMLLQLFNEAILDTDKQLKAIPINQHFERRGNLIRILRNDLFETQANIIKLFLHVADDPEITGLSANTIRQLRSARRQSLVYLQELPVCRKLFIQLLNHPRGPGRPLSLMHRHGILACYLPEWNQIVGQMQFDLFHAYTVDEHTYRVTKNLYRLTRPQHADQFLHCREVIAQLTRVDILFIAALFHDIAKGRGGDHSALGARDVKLFCQRHGYSEVESQLAAWLVENHLLMSVTAQKRDIYDPDVLYGFARQVGSLTALQHLYCLTVADLRATNDTLWNNWKAALLQELYFATCKMLQQGLKPAQPEQEIADTQKQVLAQLRGIAHDEALYLWSRFKDDYFLRHSVEEIGVHTKTLLQNYHSEPPLIVADESSERGGTEIFIYMQDQPKLFLNTVLTLDRKNLNVHDAQIMSTKDGYTLDTFIVSEQNGEPVKSLPRRDDIVESLVQAIRHNAPPQRRNEKLPRQLKQFDVESRVEFIDSDCHDRTQFEIVALDRPGLLADIAKVFHDLQLNLLAAKITTVGERAEDFFSIATQQELALDAAQKQSLQQTLLKALDTPLA